MRPSVRDSKHENVTFHGSKHLCCSRPWRKQDPSWVFGRNSLCQWSIRRRHRKWDKISELISKSLSVKDKSWVSLTQHSSPASSDESVCHPVWLTPSILCAKLQGATCQKGLVSFPLCLFSDSAGLPATSLSSFFSGKLSWSMTPLAKTLSNDSNLCGQLLMAAWVFPFALQLGNKNEANRYDVGRKLCSAQEDMTWWVIASLNRSLKSELHPAEIGKSRITKFVSLWLLTPSSFMKGMQIDLDVVNSLATQSRVGFCVAIAKKEEEVEGKRPSGNNGRALFDKWT